MTPSVRYVRALLGGIWFLACASFGTGFDWGQVDQLRQGMTIEEVHKIMGKPNSVTFAADSSTLELWMYSHATALGTGGSRSVSVKFDRLGRMVRILNRTDTEVH